MSNSSHTAAAAPLGDFTADKRVIILSVLAAFVGLMSTVVAKGLVWLIAVITNAVFFQHYATELPSLAGHHLGALVILVPALGGLIIGLMARYGSERIRGHGIPEALEAILIGQSKMDLKVAMLKPLSSAISIGTGGPFGAEGPIIMTGGAFGSLFGQLFRLTSIERRTLLVAGAAAGMCAIFNTPLAAVLLAVELLLFEWKPRSFIPVGCAVSMAGAVRPYVFGSSAPLFALPAHPSPTAEMYLISLGIGITAGLASGALTAFVYGVEDLFARLKLHWMWWPTLGGLLVGIGGFFQPRALGVGYDVIDDLLHDSIAQADILPLVLVKMLIWSLALGSGTSGGVLAPLLIIGSALGALESLYLPLPDPTIWPLISMAALMGGTMRSPLTATLFAFELTESFSALPLIFLAALVSDAVTVLLLKRSILTEKLARRGHHIIREYAVDPYDLLRVKELMATDFVCLRADLKISEFSERLARGDKELAQQYAFPILDTDKNLVGILTRGDVIRALETDSSGSLSVAEAGTKEVLVAHPNDLVTDVVNLMVLKNIGRVPVVKQEDPKQVVGYLGRAQIIAGRSRNIREERFRERGHRNGVGTETTTAF